MVTFRHMSGQPAIHKTLPGDPSVPLVLRRAARARRITLRVSALDGRVTVTMPHRSAEADAMRFVAGKRDWVHRQLARVAARRPVAMGSVLPVDGVCREIVADGPQSPATIVVRPSRAIGPQVRRVVIDAAHERFSEAVARHAGALGVRPGPIRLRDPRSRWGSCGSDGRLMFSWRLILAPVEVADYVAAHEVAHLVRMDHSPAFWSVVAGLCPDHARCRTWLRAEGHHLHAWRFEPA